MQPTNQMRWFETISPLFDANYFSQGSFIFEVSGWTIEKHETTKQPTLQKKNKETSLLGGFNPSKKNWSKWVKIKNIWNHHLVLPFPGFHEDLPVRI